MTYLKIQESGNLPDLELIDSDELDFDPMNISEDDARELEKIRKYLEEHRKNCEDICSDQPNEVDQKIYECEIAPINKEYERFIEEMHYESSDDFTFDWDEEFYTRIKNKGDKFDIPDPEDL